MPKMTGARFLADFLEAQGVTHVFFVPAVLMQTMREIERKNSVQRILCHSEKAAAYMADGYARASGRPGVCIAQKIGASNLASGLRDPHLACTPLIAITGGDTAATRGRNTYQQVEDVPAFKPVTKWSGRVDDLARLPDVLRQAFRAATTGTPGPVHVEMAGHLAEIEYGEADLEVLAEELFGSTPPFRPLAGPQAVQAAARALEGAERPVIVAGGGVRTSGAGAELRALAETLQIPVATALNAKDTFPGDHPLALGVPGTYSRETANRALLEADLVFFVASRTSNQLTCQWRVPRPGIRVVQLDINGEELGRHYPAEVALMGDAKVTLAALAEAADPATATRRGEWAGRCRALVADWRATWAPALASNAMPIRPERLCGELTAWLPEDAILVSDTGHSGMWTGGLVDLNRPGQSYLRAAGSLGWGIPAGIGAKLAQPDRAVVVFSGDGGFWYHFGELETAVRRGVPVVVVVNDNNGLNQGIDEEIAARGGKLEGRHGEVWQFSGTDLAGVARSLGAEGIRVERPGDLRSALDQAVAFDRPCLVDVVSDSYAQAPLAYLGD